MLRCRVDWLVELAGTSDRGTIRGLCHVGHDLSWRLHHPSRLRTRKLAGFSADDTHHAHPWMRQQYAYKMDR